VTDWIAAIALCTGFAIAGWWWVSAVIGERMGLVPHASFAYLFGTALVTLAELGVAFVGIPLGRVAILGAAAAVTSAGWLVARRRTPIRSVPVDGPLPTALLLLMPAAVALGVATIHAWSLGHVDQVDFLRAWGRKGLSLYYYRDLEFTHLGSPYAYYPLELSNVFGTLYVMLGHVNDSVIRLPMALYGIAMAPSSWWLLRHVMPPAAAAGAVSLAVATPQFIIHSSLGQADLALTVYLTIAALAAFLWLVDGGDRYAALAGLMAGAASWTKLEGAFTAVVILLAVVAVRRSLRTPGLLPSIAWLAAFVVPWQVFQQLHGIAASHRHFATLYVDLPWILRHVGDALLSTSRWGVFWPLCLALITISTPFWMRTRFRLLAAVTLPNLVITLGAMMTHYRAGSASSVSVTAPRLYLHLAPGIAMMAAAGVLTAVRALRKDASQPRSARVSP
jgi:dolichyl-phosphate-mannose-protein mannosyltransferase